MLIKYYTIVAIPDVEHLNVNTHAARVTKHDIIVERIIATSYLKALRKFKDFLEIGLAINQIRFPIDKYNFFELNGHGKKLSDFEIRSHYWNFIKVAVAKHNGLILKEQYLNISRTAISKVNKNEIQRRLDSCSNEDLQNIYEKARSYSFSILREIACKSSPYTAWLILDIGEAFHNHHQVNDSRDFRDDIMSDLFFYEEWIYTLMELNHFYHFHLIDSYTITNIIDTL
jgi:hypothetical protein